MTPREISLEEVAKHKTLKNVWVVVNNDVLDVTKYIDEHPGGVDVIMEVAGTDATQAFEDIGHSDDAREVAAKYKIGVLPLSERRAKKSESKCSIKKCAIIKGAALALAGAVIIAVVVKKYAK